MSDVTVTQVARNFAEYVNRVAYRRESFTLVRGKKPLAELRPLPSKTERTSNTGTSACRTSGMCHAKWTWPSSTADSSMISRVTIGLAAS